MTGPPRVEITPALLHRLGQGYLHNVRRVPGLTCSVCGTVVSPSYTMCRPCESHVALGNRLGVELATQVLPIVYGVDGEQSGHMMYTYKSSRATTRQRNQPLMIGLLAHQEHRRCMEGYAVGFRPIDSWSGVPSTRERPGVHPIDRLGAKLDVGPYLALVPGPRHGDADRRALVPDRWGVAQPHLARGRHVLLVDDTWTSGARAQSAAAALRTAGADAVTVLVIARWMNREFGNSDAFLTNHVTAEYSPEICPVPGADCRRAGRALV